MNTYKRGSTPVEEAVSMITEAVSEAVDTEQCPLLQSTGRVLAEDVGL